MSGCGIINITKIKSFVYDSRGVSMPDEFSPSHKPELPTGHDLPGGDLPQRWVIVRHTTIWHPPTDVYEQSELLIVVVEIAGMQDSDFNVVLQGQRLVISGIRRRVAATDYAYHQMEISFGEFRTEVNLPWAVQRDNVSATYRDGFLRVELPHAPAQQIQIVNLDEDSTQDDLHPDELDNGEF
jgi:HSP20 family molecular chaperone IbpA